MADWNTAYNWMMDNEDAARAYKTVPDACPDGVEGLCHVVSGINSGAFPKEFAAIAALPNSSRGNLVEEFYLENFWNCRWATYGSWYAQLASDEVAKRVFDMAVNGGAGTAVKILQEAVNVLLAVDHLEIACDRQWGPQTIKAANQCSGLVPAFRAQRIAHYKAVVAADPSKAKYLDAWIARAMK